MTLRIKSLLKAVAAARRQKKWQAAAVRKRQVGEVVVVVGRAGDVSSADGLRGAADQTFMLLCHSRKKRRRGGRE